MIPPPEATLQSTLVPAIWAPSAVSSRTPMGTGNLKPAVHDTLFGPTIRSTGGLDAVTCASPPQAPVSESAKAAPTDRNGAAFMQPPGWHDGSRAGALRARPNCAV